jgi:hypothetical protein
MNPISMQLGKSEFDLHTADMQQSNNAAQLLACIVKRVAVKMKSAVLAEVP